MSKKFLQKSGCRCSMGLSCSKVCFTTKAQKSPHRYGCGLCGDVFFHLYCAICSAMFSLAALVSFIG